MAKDYDSTDWAWTKRGDYVISPEGDVLDTEYDPLRSLAQEVESRVEADKADWSLYRHLGLGLSDFIGEPNTKENAENIKVRLIDNITAGGLVSPYDIKIIYAPIDIDKILFKIKIKVAPTGRNRGSEILNLKFLYSYSENNVYRVNE